MDESEYAEKAVGKIQKYLDCGYVPNENIIFLMETRTSGLRLSSLNKTLDIVLN